jgi:nucleoside phosphorylase
LQIERKLRYLQLAAQARHMPDFDVGLCVITALSDPELAAVLRLPWGWQQLDIERDGTQYHEGSYPAGDGNRRVVAACSPQIGMTAAAVLATKMIYNFTPRYLAMVGIAAGMRGSCSLGDVIAGDPCWDWGSGKYSILEGESKFEAAPVQIGLNSFIRGRLGSMARDQLLWDSIRNGWQGARPDTVLKMHIGPFASGAAVLSDGAVTLGIRAQQRKLLAIDMEAYGVLAAANEAPLPQPGAFVLKGVVDFADKEKSDSYQAYASYTSAMALKHFVEVVLNNEGRTPRLPSSDVRSSFV